MIDWASVLRFRCDGVGQDCASEIGVPVEELTGISVLGVCDSFLNSVEAIGSEVGGRRIEMECSCR